MLARSEPFRSVPAKRRLRLAARRGSCAPDRRRGTSRCAHPLRYEEGGAAVGAAEQTMCGSAAQPPLGVAAPTEVGGAVWCSVKHGFPFDRRRDRGALRPSLIGVPLDTSHGGAASIRGPRLREHAGHPVLDRARVGDAGKCSASVRMCPVTMVGVPCSHERDDPRRSCPTPAMPKPTPCSPPTPWPCSSASCSTSR